MQTADKDGDNDRSAGGDASLVIRAQSLLNLDKSYWSTTSERYAPGNFVTTWNPDLGRDAVGVTRAIADVQEANPLILVKWMHDLSEEWVRAEYLSLSKVGA